LHLPIENIELVSPEISLELLALDAALTRLEEFDGLKSQIVELRAD
jgi:hypothetical protein